MSAHGENKKVNHSKNSLILLGCLLLVCLIFAQAPTIQVTLPNNSQTISALRTVHYPALTEIKKYTSAYGCSEFPNDVADYLSNNFDWVNAHFSAQSITGFRRMKSNNPHLIITVYRDVMGVYPSSILENPDWDVINQHEDWFIHDKNGNRVQNRYWNWYLMDVGNAEWRNFYANWCANVLQEQTIDGIFADDVWDTVPTGNLSDAWWNPWTVPNSYLDEKIGDRWHNDMLTFIQYVKQRIGNKLLIINSQKIDDYLNACDGRMEEEFVHPGWWPYTEYDGIDWTTKVNGVMEDGTLGKLVMVSSGFSELDQSTSDEIEKMLMYCFASYLLALNGNKTYFGFGSYWDSARGYYPIFDAAKVLGSPVNDYYPYQGVYARDFQNGTVLVNPSASSYAITLNQNFKTLDGLTISNIMITDHTGIILFTP